MRILTIQNKKDAKFLKKKTKDFDFSSMSKKELRDLVADMKKTMLDADGVGLAANQVGINARFFVAEMDNKFYAIFNPEILKTSDMKSTLEQGCLSVPDKKIEVERPAEIVLKGFDKNGKTLKIRAWGLLAQIFQHEVDHLNGKIITDYAKKK